MSRLFATLAFCPLIATATEVVTGDSFPLSQLAAEALLGWYLFYNVKFAQPRREQKQQDLILEIEAEHTKQIEKIAAPLTALSEYAIERLKEGNYDHRDPE